MLPFSFTRHNYTVPSAAEPINRGDYVLDVGLLSVQELTLNDFDNVSPIGSGNGGVVWKVAHKASRQILARKVRPVHSDISTTTTPFSSIL